jgi:hypothetical protein
MSAGGNNESRKQHVEQIVRQVLAELLGGSTKPGSNVALGELVLVERVVSVRELEGKLVGVTRVLVPRGAVFTPAARDLLKEKRIAVASAVATSTNKTAKRVTVGIAETTFEPATLVSELTRDGWQVERLPLVGLMSVSDELCEQVVKGGVRGLLITEQTSAALCLANRRSGMRAALAGDPVSLAAAIEQVAPNMLVIDPRGKSQFAWKRLLKTWSDVGQRDCPEHLRTILG